MSSNDENKPPSQSTVKAPTPSAIANAGEMETPHCEEKDDMDLASAFSLQQTLNPPTLARHLNDTSVSPNLFNERLNNVANHWARHMISHIPPASPYVPPAAPAVPMDFTWEGGSGTDIEAPYADFGPPPHESEPLEAVQPANPEPVYQDTDAITLAPTPDRPGPPPPRSRRATLTRDSRQHPHPYASPGGIRSSISANTGLNTPSRARQHPSHNRVASLSRYPPGYIPSPLQPVDTMADRIFRGADGNPYPVPGTSVSTPGWLPTPHIGDSAPRPGEGIDIGGIRMYPAERPAYPEPFSPATHLADQTGQLRLGFNNGQPRPPAIPVPTPGDIETIIRGPAIEALRAMETEPRFVNFADPEHVIIFGHYFDIVMLPHLDERTLRRFYTIINRFVMALDRYARFISEYRGIIPRAIVAALDDLRERAIKLFGNRAKLVEICTTALAKVQELVDNERRAMELLEADEDL